MNMSCMLAQNFIGDKHGKPRSRDAPRQNGGPHATAGTACIVRAGAVGLRASGRAAIASGSGQAKNASRQKHGRSKEGNLSLHPPSPQALIVPATGGGRNAGRTPSSLAGSSRAVAEKPCLARNANQQAFRVSKFQQRHASFSGGNVGQQSVFT